LGLDRACAEIRPRGNLLLRGAPLVGDGLQLRGDFFHQGGGGFAGF
jgi:hypothetical protein